MVLIIRKFYCGNKALKWINTTCLVGNVAEKKNHLTIEISNISVETNDFIG